MLSPVYSTMRIVTLPVVDDDAINYLAKAAESFLWTHESVQAQFSGQLINRRKRYSVDLGRALIENRALRERADYQPVAVSRIQASRALGGAGTFVKAVEQGTEQYR